MLYRDYSKQFKPGSVPEDNIRGELIDMENNPELDTRISLVRSDGKIFRLMSFQEKHLLYLREHPSVNPIPYLSNLRTMIKVRKNN